jgi:predicted metal-binding protein
MSVQRRDSDAPLRGPQDLEDLAAGSWLGETLFAALELGVFEALGEQSLPLAELARRCGADAASLARLAQVLSVLGLLSLHQEQAACTTLARRHLLPGRPGYLGNSLAYRRRLARTWTNLADAVRAGGSPLTPPERESDEEYRGRVRAYLLAMDDVARIKATLIAARLDLAQVHPPCVLDLGGGAGGITAGVLLRNPGWRGLVVDVPEVIAAARRLWAERLAAGDGAAARLLAPPGEPSPLEFAACDLLHGELPAAPEGSGGWGLIVASNIVHAYAAAEAGALLERAAAALAPDGLLVVHDFWTDGPGRGPLKAAVFDLHMLIHTYQGRTYPWSWARDRLAASGLRVAGPVPLGERDDEQDTSLLVAVRGAAGLAAVRLELLEALDGTARELGLLRTAPIDPGDLTTAAWVREKCEHGCARYGRGGQCPPRAPAPEQTRELFSGYRRALLVHGEPPGAAFHERLLALERAAFLSGCPKALCLVAGPCSLCEQCRPDDCRSPDRARRSLEAAGVDVYAAAATVGWRLEPVPDHESPVAYIGLLLVE